MKTKILFSFLSLLIFSAAPAFANNQAEAVLKGTAEGSALSGTVHFEQAGDALKVTAEISGAPAGKHGFHIHEKGDCGDTGKAAGGHFNPDKVEHGLLPKDGFTMAHAGDLGNIEIGPDGKGKLEVTVQRLSLGTGKYDIDGKAVILHEKEDDFGQPTGNAGGRIGCGVIEKK